MQFDYNNRPMLGSAQRFAACLGLTGYLLVATAGAWLHGQLHDHGPALVAAADSPQSAARAGHACCGHSHGAPPPAPHATCPGESPGGTSCPHPHEHAPGHDDDCFVCQVLAASRFVSAPVAFVVATETIAPAVAPPVLVPDAPAPALPSPRGPPCRVV